MARPTDYDPAHCETAIAAGRSGKSLTWLAAEIDVSRDTLYEWAKVHPEFSDALTRMRQLAQRWWEDAGQDGMKAAGFNASVWSRSMAARFPDDWREVKGTEITGKDGGPVQSVAKVDVAGLSDGALREIAALRANDR